MSELAYTVREIAAGSLAHRGELALRYVVLRAPLGMAPGTEWNAKETDCRHWVAQLDAGSGQAVVGCVLFLPSSDTSGAAGTGRLLQMAVHPSMQGQGVGRALVRALEADVQTDGIGEVTLHARQHAIGFYERLGYACYGDPYTEVGIPHRHMKRTLDAD